MKFTFRRDPGGAGEAFDSQKDQNEDQEGGAKPRYWLAAGPAIIVLLLVGAITTGTVFAQGSGSPDSTSGTPATTSNSTSSTSSSTGSKLNLGDTFLNNLADALGISRTTLNGDLTTAAKDTIQQAVTAGKLTQAQADKLSQAIDNGHLKGLLGMLGKRAWAQSQRQGWRGIGGGIANVLDMQPSELASELKSGKTLQQVITEHDKTAADVVNAVVAQVKTKLDAKVAANTLTQAQETRILDGLKTQLTNAIKTNQISGPFHLNIGGWMHGKPDNANGNSASPDAQQATPSA